MTPSIFRAFWGGGQQRRTARLTDISLRDSVSFAAKPQYPGLPGHPLPILPTGEPAVEFRVCRRSQLRGQRWIYTNFLSALRRFPLRQLEPCFNRVNEDYLPIDYAAIAERSGVQKVRPIRPR